MSSAVAFGSVVREARKKLGLSQEQLADASELHRNAIGLVERGERSPSVDTVLAIAKGLRMRPSDLMILLEQEIGLAQEQPVGT